MLVIPLGCGGCVLEHLNRSSVAIESAYGKIWRLMLQDGVLWFARKELEVVSTPDGNQISKFCGWADIT